MRGRPHLEIEGDAEGRAALGVLRLQPRVQLPQLAPLLRRDRRLAAGGQALRCPQRRVEAVVVRLLCHQLPAGREGSNPSLSAQPRRIAQALVPALGVWPPHSPTSSAAPSTQAAAARQAEKYWFRKQPDAL